MSTTLSPPSVSIKALAERGESSRSRCAGPPIDSIPRYPMSWYRIGSSAEIGSSPVSRRMLGRMFVAYRGASGRAVVMDGRCAHQGADLVTGTVVGDALRCPFHGWEFGADGVCSHIPACAEVPGFARLRSYPVAERHGSVYFFNAGNAIMPLPFFPGLDPDEYVAARPLIIHYDGPWFMIVANAFDMQHFRVVHDRRLLEEPIIDSPSPLSHRMRYKVAVEGRCASDRLLRTLVGAHADVEQTVWCGNLLTTHARFPRADSRVFFAVEPLESGGTRMSLTVLLRRSGSRNAASPRRLAELVSLWIRRKLTAAFLRHEQEQLHSIRYSPSTLIEADREMIKYLQWLTTLPTCPSPPGSSVA